MSENLQPWYAEKLWKAKTRPFYWRYHHAHNPTEPDFLAPVIDECRGLLKKSLGEPTNRASDDWQIAVVLKACALIRGNLPSRPGFEADPVQQLSRGMQSRECWETIGHIEKKFLQPTRFTQSVSWVPDGWNERYVVLTEPESVFRWSHEMSVVSLRGGMQALIQSISFRPLPVGNPYLLKPNESVYPYVRMSYYVTSGAEKLETIEAYSVSADPRHEAAVARYEFDGSRWVSYVGGVGSIAVEGRNHLNNLDFLGEEQLPQAIDFPMVTASFLVAAGERQTIEPLALLQGNL